MYEMSGQQDKERFFRDVVNNNIERAIEVEREASDGKDPNKEYTLGCLSELSSLSVSDVEAAKEYLSEKTSRFKDGPDSEKDLSFYHELAQNILDDKGPFYNQVSMFMESNPFITSPDNVDFRRRVTVRAFTWLLYPLLQTRAAMETEKKQSEYRKRAAQIGDFLKDAFQELSEVDFEGKARGLKFEIKSILAQHPEHWEGSAGKYSKGLITIPYQQRTEDEALMHEIIHGLSDNCKTARFEDDNLSKGAIRNLTEAVVEEATFFASEQREDDGYSSYPKQRKALAELRRMFAGDGMEIPLSLFVSALIKHQPLDGILEQSGFSKEQKKKFYAKANVLFAAPSSS